MTAHAGLAAQVPSRAGDEEKLAGIQMAMYMMTLRSLSLVFSHAIWTGIASYYIAFSVAHRRSFLVYFLAGLAISATLHGLYDWMLGIQVTLASMIIALSFFIFYGYLRVLNSTPTVHEPPPPVSATIVPKQV
ncbi:MAG TPA: PrsW family glutamic-type intramembrane protease [Gemmatales bacterium]|nr:PrsW family glutamic-type intramembrane protease [Gemmatales bacterium]